MIATVLTLLLMAMVVQIFATVGNATADTRAVLEMNERIRNCKITLQADLANITAPMLPPLKVEDQAGYFEYLEGPRGPFLPSAVVPIVVQAIDSERGLTDTTVGDIDDVLTFTTRNESQPFYGRIRINSMGKNVAVPAQWTDTTTTSNYAEVCYFVRGNTLYRRVLLVRGDLNAIDPSSLSSNYSSPNINLPGSVAYLYNISFYDKYDISVRQVGGTYDTTGGTQPVPTLVANTLGDLTRRENRYGHQSHAYPYDARFWSYLGLPTLRECTFYTDIFNATPLGTTARWPFPFYDPNFNATLWGAASPTPQNSVVNPSIYVVPSGPAAYQLYYQNATIPPLNYFNANLLAPAATPGVGSLPVGGLPQYINLTQNGVPATTQDSWLIPPMAPAYTWDQVSPLNLSIAAFSLSPDERDPLPPLPPAPPSQYNASTRVSDDVILTNVISFDVKAWDPNAAVVNDTTTGITYLPGDAGYIAALGTVNGTTIFIVRGAYVDLNYLAQASAAIQTTFASIFSGPGKPTFPLLPGLPPPMLYDTGCFNYEEDGIDQDGVYGPDQYTNGFDDNGIGGVDDITELEGPIPYAVPLKGIQVKIRVFEPDSRQIREITVVEDFLWE